MCRMPLECCKMHSKRHWHLKQAESVHLGRLSEVMQISKDTRGNVALKVLKGVLIRYIWRTTGKDLMPVGDVEIQNTCTKIALPPYPLKMVTERLNPFLMLCKIVGPIVCFMLVCSICISIVYYTSRGCCTKFLKFLFICSALVCTPPYTTIAHLQIPLVSKLTL